MLDSHVASTKSNEHAISYYSAELIWQIAVLQQAQTFQADSTERLALYSLHAWTNLQLINTAYST